MSEAAPLQGSYDVAVIGAGPAGLAASTITARAGLSTIVLDENAAPGGQVWRGVTNTPVQAGRILGKAYWAGAEIVRAFEASGATFVPQATVWSVSREREIGISFGGAAHMIVARRVILANGALERPFPIPGWTLPGVMTIGAAQTLLKSSGLMPGGRVVLAGSGPLLWLFARQTLEAGGRVQAILDTSDPAARRKATGHLPRFVLSPYAWEGMKLLAGVRRHVRVLTGIDALAALGRERLEAVTFRRRGEGGARMPADLLLLHQGVVPNVNLAMAAGVEHRWDEDQLCFVPVVDEAGTTSIDGVAIAGDGAGIGGAEAALDRGRLAAFAAVRALAPAAVNEEQVEAARRRLGRYMGARPFLDQLYRPSRQFRIPSGDTIACRCEEVTAQQITDAVRIGCIGPNQMKAFLRCGMGPCQARLCGLTVSELIADARGVNPAVVGYTRIRPPVKPITLGELGSLPKPEAAVAAVVRS